MRIRKIFGKLFGYEPRVRIAPKYVEIPLKEGKVVNNAQKDKFFLQKRGILTPVRHETKEEFEKHCNDVFLRQCIRPH